MKLRSFFALIASAAMLLTACSESEDGTEDVDDSTTTATSISIDQPTLELEVGDYTTLVATLEPDGATGTITWTSSDATVAAVSDAGVVVAVAAGTANVVASCGSLTATCAVTVNAAGLHASLQGSDYYLVALDYISYDEIASEVVADLRVDDINSCLYVWSGYDAGTCSGVNAYGQTESWSSFSVTAPDGWSGLGYCVGVNGEYDALNSLAAVTDSPKEFYLHIAMKSSTPVSHYIKMEDIGAGGCVIGNNGAIDSRDVDYELTTDGEWQHFDIPMTHFTDQGFAFNTTHDAGTNVFIVLSGATVGAPLDYDAVFFYKK